MTRDSVHIVKIAGDAGLRSAQEIAGLLREAVKNHSEIAVATDAISNADITTIQLLLAANTLATAQGKSLVLLAPPIGALRELLIQTGCLDALGQPLTPVGEFWIPITPAKGKAA